MVFINRRTFVSIELVDKFDKLNNEGHTFPAYILLVSVKQLCNIHIPLNCPWSRQFNISNSFFSGSVSKLKSGYWLENDDFFTTTGQHFEKRNKTNLHTAFQNVSSPLWQKISHFQDGLCKSRIILHKNPTLLHFTHCPNFFITYREGLKIQMKMKIHLFFFWRNLIVISELIFFQPWFRTPLLTDSPLLNRKVQKILALWTVMPMLKQYLISQLISQLFLCSSKNWIHYITTVEHNCS